VKNYSSLAKKCLASRNNKLQAHGKALERFFKLLIIKEQGLIKSIKGAKQRYSELRRYNGLFNQNKKGKAKKSDQKTEEDLYAQVCKAGRS